MTSERDEGGEVERVEARAVERFGRCGVNVERAKKTIAEKGLPRHFLDIVCIVCGLIMGCGKKDDFYVKRLSMVLSVILDTEINCEMIRRGEVWFDDSNLEEYAKFGVDNLSTDILFVADIYLEAWWWELEPLGWCDLPIPIPRSERWRGCWVTICPELSLGTMQSRSNKKIYRVYSLYMSHGLLLYC
jgi:hypothetical protein